MKERNIDQAKDEIALQTRFFGKEKKGKGSGMWIEAQQAITTMVEETPKISTI